MSLCSRFLEDAKQDLRRADREVRRQLRVLDLRLQLHRLCDDPLPPCVCSRHLHPHCCCALHPYPRCLCDLACRASCLAACDRRLLRAQLNLERELASTRRRLNKTLNSSHDHKLLALMDVKGFDPDEVTVKVKDGKVKVLAEHEEEYSTIRGKEYNYKNIRKEISLPPGVDEDEVVYSVGPNSVVKIETPRKRYPCLMSL
ncbi:outer dense fiber protein 1 [Dromaius novaehollandiae]|nr:outer dense fiber protein 1 [Dromaius novaehollandiae]XP_025975445.1 outer dense fiber protein 1 [Dromaius novaehollandiae]XP_025975446.1 outer dense fiber protein 1 [Dromaius novaehollandiae]XP_025975447.1 outer dense fiber protein 1 [Dromaius novaehollandiae]